MIIKEIIASVAFALLLAHPVDAADSGYTIHEWGTFTSVQGSDGIQLSWQAAQVSELPGFVYNWTKPGFNRLAPWAVFGKGSLSGQQRMETPVVYFYADQEQAVDISVAFPKGTITEWYPQAQRIGPVLMTNATGVNAFGFSNSRVQWSGVKVVPSKASGSSAALPNDRSGSHYFAARATDSALLDVRPPDGKAEHEKFLFYRGIGSFSTPLQTIIASGNQLTLTNSGPEPLTHLFMLTVKAGRGKFTRLESLASAKAASIQLDSADAGLPLDKLTAKLGQALAQGLESEGLFPREAAAMVATWEDSWFTEEGTRVLYVLPAAWTDTTLPMTLSPQPRERVRVMVGRAEIITPAVETELLKTLTNAKGGDAGARRQTISQFKKLGRFAEPALRLACRNAPPAGIELFGYQLLAEATSPGKLAFAPGSQPLE